MLAYPITQELHIGIKHHLKKVNQSNMLGYLDKY